MFITGWFDLFAVDCVVFRTVSQLWTCDLLCLELAHKRILNDPFVLR